MEKSNVYQLPNESVVVYLDRYTAQRLLLALTQALEPGNGGKYYKKKSKKGKAYGGQTGMKLSKKGYKGAPTYGLKLTKAGGKSGAAKGATKMVPKTTTVAPKTSKTDLVAPKGGAKGATTSAAAKGKAKRRAR